jgi:MBOAT, membrane-bound O-acyltransferase family
MGPVLILAGFLAPYAVACAAFKLLLARTAPSWMVSASGCLAILACPWFIPADSRLLRYLASLSAVLLAAKLIDVSMDLKQRRAFTASDFLAFLGNPFTLVRRKLVQEPCPSQAENWLHLLKGSAGCAMCLLLLAGLFRADWSGVHFWLEHASKVVVFMGAVFGGLTAGAALWRVGGGTARDFMDSPHTAHTPAQFWRRYNRVVQQFFWQDLFSGVGGRRAPIRTLLLVFALSALVHELIFFTAIGRVQGYQTAFFALHGIAAALTARVKVRGWAVLPCIVATLAFNLGTSALFFASIHGVVPFYSRGLPPWLQGW